MNFAERLERLAAERPDQAALLHGDLRRTWRGFEERASALAAGLLDAGLTRQAPVMQLLVNGPEYLETVFACFKASMVPANTNHRYGPDEMAFVWNDARTEAVVFHGSFVERVAAVRASDQSTVRLWVHVDDGTAPCPDWAVPYESLAASGRRADVERNDDDLLLLYTGGTTGRPKGVMWPQGDLVTLFTENAGVASPLHLPACPLMHGTGLFSSLNVLCAGGTIATLTGRSFDPVELLDTVERHGVKSIAIVGDPFARPIVAALDAEPGRWDISSLTMVVSSGVAWSEDSKHALLRHHPELTLVDSLGSSEAVGMGSAVTRREGDRPATSHFTLGERTRVIDDEGKDVVPGSGEIGRIALSGPGPCGYLNDPEKSSQTFPVIDGVQYMIPGDYATVEADGTLVLLGRGSACINTGGEKVFPEEVEEALKADPAVLDAAVVGLPDPTWGERVVAIVEPAPGATIDPDSLIEAVKARLAGYKAPRHIVVGPVGRHVTGKLDYQAIRQRVLSAI